MASLLIQAKSNAVPMKRSYGYHQNVALLKVASVSSLIASIRLIMNRRRAPFRVRNRSTGSQNNGACATRVSSCVLIFPPPTYIHVPLNEYNAHGLLMTVILGREGHVVPVLNNVRLCTHEITCETRNCCGYEVHVSRYS